MIEIVLIAVIGGALASLLFAIRGGERALEVLSKGAASAGFVILGMVRWTASDPIDTWILVGLALCAIGDILLLWDRTFGAGLGSFLLGHVAYIFAFTTALPMDHWPPLMLAPVLLASIGAGSWMWPHLGRRRLSVAAYIVAISVMVWGGFSVVGAGAMGWTAGVGAVLFYLSDLAVARHRFVKPEFINRGVGLPLYYAGQILIALSM